MDRPQSEIGRRWRMAKNKERVPCLPPVPPMVRPPPPNPVKLAAIAVNLNIRLRSADMPGAMQERAFRCTRTLLDATSLESKKPNPTHIAMCLKKEFDEMYGLAWHCVVGKSFGSFITCSSGGFVYFSVDNLSFLLFKTEVQPVKKPPPLRKLNA
ncbi:hypothetical protein NC652_001380 [Populus alba x Populus x berolinensis]|uniref:Dynein light chain n=1 Tax=Populus tomentosa TaxID=118781 RepID=A0A8X8IUR7_POPTO|nr:hypothetical protein POTOM_004564 [Populus tomentosa]KAG6791881.1 hypothetical protein POTOM_001015 [Populus tomentosa]KAJ6962707.1 hypothetical protein NC652_001380 [Populus alba x Populus x berolinensis]